MQTTVDLRWFSHGTKSGKHSWLNSRSGLLHERIRKCSTIMKQKYDLSSTNTMLYTSSLMSFDITCEIKRIHNTHSMSDIFTLV